MYSGSLKSSVCSAEGYSILGRIPFHLIIIPTDMVTIRTATTPAMYVENLLVFIISVERDSPQIGHIIEALGIISPQYGHFFVFIRNK